ncbi:MAG: type 1 glutamine amidotransferase domain-containing protein [Enhygromyxa sp.]
MRILFPLPNRGFDPTETAVPWKTLTEAGHEVVFATPDGRPSAADYRITSGSGFGPFRPWLRARPHARELYTQMEASEAFRHPLPYADLDADEFDAVLLTGGHAEDMKSYLESEIVQSLVVAHFKAGKPVGAICHGVLVPARAIDPETGESVLHGRKTTALPRVQELSAWAMTGLWLGSYYRTYKKTVEEEVSEALASPEDFEAGPFTMQREGPDKPEIGFVVRDGNYVSGRYYVDAYRFAETFVSVLAEHTAARMREAASAPA